MNDGFFRKIDELIARRAEFSVLTVWDELSVEKYIHTGNSILSFSPDIDCPEDVLLKASCPANGPATTVTVKGHNLDIFVERFQPAFRLLILGAGHIAVPLNQFARILDYDTVVIDDRADYASPDRFPGAGQVIARPFADALNDLTYDQSTGIVIITRGHSYDSQCLEQVIDKPVAYIGMIGSQRRTAMVMRKIKEKGVAEELIRRVKSPIGIPIGGASPAEIALSIIVEVACVLNKGEPVLEQFRDCG